MHSMPFGQPTHWVPILSHEQTFGSAQSKSLLRVTWSSSALIEAQFGSPFGS